MQDIMTGSDIFTGSFIDIQLFWEHLIIISDILPWWFTVLVTIVLD